MLRVRPKLGSERSSEWRCCCCLHVRSGTIILGIWHIGLHLLALGVLAAVVRDPRLLNELEQDSTPDWSNMGQINEMPTPQSNVVPTPLTSANSLEGTQQRNRRLVYHEVDVGALVTVCTLAMTLMLIYGALRGKPAHLLPFLCLQLFDFAITVVTATGYLCYLRSVHRLVAECRNVPWRAQLLRLPAPVLGLVVICAFLAGLLFKAYCINMVWRCYKYLMMRSHALQNLTPFVISRDTAPAPPSYAQPAPQPPAPYSSLLPDYEEAVKQTPPPSYRAATLMAPDTDATPKPSSPQPAHTVVIMPNQGTQDRV